MLFLITSPFSNDENMLLVCIKDLNFEQKLHSHSLDAHEWEKEGEGWGEEVGCKGVKPSAASHPLLRRDPPCIVLHFTALLHYYTALHLTDIHCCILLHCLVKPSAASHPLLRLDLSLILPLLDLPNTHLRALEIRCNRTYIEFPACFVFVSHIWKSSFERYRFLA